MSALRASSGPSALSATVGGGRFCFHSPEVSDFISFCVLEKLWERE